MASIIINNLSTAGAGAANDIGAATGTTTADKVKALIGLPDAELTQLENIVASGIDAIKDGSVYRRTSDAEVTQVENIIASGIDAIKDGSVYRRTSDAEVTKIENIIASGLDAVQNGGTYGRTTLAGANVANDIGDTAGATTAAKVGALADSVTAHHARHQHGGADEIATATAAANAIPKAGAGGTLAKEWLPQATSSAIGGALLGAKSGAPLLASMPDSAVADYSNEAWTGGNSSSVDGWAANSVALTYETGAVIVTASSGGSGRRIEKTISLAAGKIVAVEVQAVSASKPIVYIGYRAAVGGAYAPTAKRIDFDDLGQKKTVFYELPVAIDRLVIYVNYTAVTGDAIKVMRVWVGSNPVYLEGSLNLKVPTWVNDLIRVEAWGVGAKQILDAIDTIADSNTFKVEDVTYTWKTALTPTDGEVLIGASNTEALANAALAINEGSTGANYGTKHYCGTRHPHVKGIASDAKSLTIQDWDWTAGTANRRYAGNLIALTGTTGKVSWRRSTLQGGYSDLDAKVRAASKQGNVFSIYLPPLYAVVGREMNVYLDNLIGRDSSLYDWSATCTIGALQAERFTVTPVAAGSFSLTIAAYDKETGALLASEKSYITVVAAAAGSGTPNVIAIGDSTTEGGQVTGELLTLMGADGAMDVALIGTIGTAPNLHEGRSGWAAQTFATSGSPFWIGGKVDFPAYMSAGGFAGCDIAIIHLGINDIGGATSEESARSQAATARGYLNTLIASIQAYNASVKIGLAVTIPPSASQDAFGASYSTSKYRALYKRALAQFWSMLFTTYARRESEGIYLVPYNTALDTVHNMSKASAAAWNSRTSETTTRQDNGVHPANIGYYQIADALYAWIKAIS